MIQEGKSMSTGTVGATGPQQFYVTHCARTDSVLNTVGFSVRAASSTEPALLKTAMEYPAYELPMDMWSKKPGRADAPRRLARVRVAGGVMVVHTSYLEKDTMNRDRSYFTHVVLLPDLSPADVLKSWNSEGWVTDYASGMVQKLAAPGDKMSRGSDVSDTALEQFLTVKDLGKSTCLAETVWPERLRADPAARWKLVGQVLHGLWLASDEASRGGPRGRLFIHAEPGLVALLVYAAARLLPDVKVADLTFTTFEPAHRGLREFKRTLVVGTYLANPAKGLEPELVTARGYAVDALNPARGSPELQGELPLGVAALLDLTAARKRNSLKAIHALCGTGHVSLADLGRAVTLSGAIERLDESVPTPEDLVALQRDPLGRNAVAAREATLWPLVRDLAVDQDRSDIREAFKPWFTQGDRVDQLTSAGFAALLQGKVAGWESRWRVLKAVLPNPAQLGSALDRLLTRQNASIKGLSPDARRVLRAGLGAVSGMSPDAIAPLLSPRTVAELDNLLIDQNLPSWGAAYAVMIARLSNDPSMLVRVRNYLTKADQGVLGEYARQIEDHIDTHPVLAEELFDLAADGTAPQFDKLLNTGSEFVKPARWMWAANHRIKLFEGDNWLEILTTKLRLAKFLRAVGADPVGKPAWDWVLDRIDLSILDERSWGRTVWAELDKAEVLISNDGADPATVVPRSLARRRLAGRILLALTDEKGHQERFSPDQIRAAFQVFDLIDPMGLQEIFNRTCKDTTPATNPKAFDRFADVFGSLFPPSETDFQSNNRALNHWLAVTSSSRYEHQRQLQEFFFEESSRLSPKNPSQRRALLDEDRKIPIISQVAADVRILSNRQEEVKTPSKSSKPKGRGKRKKAFDQNRIVLISGIAAVIVLVIVIVVGVTIRNRGAREQVSADQKAADQKAADQKAADQKAAVQRAAVQNGIQPPRKDFAADPGAGGGANKVGGTPRPVEPQAVEKTIEVKNVEAFREWVKKVTASRKALSEQYSKVEIGGVPEGLKAEVDALLKKYDEFDGLADRLTPADRSKEKVDELRLQIARDKADWNVLKDLLEGFKTNPLEIPCEKGEQLLNEMNTKFDKLGEEAKPLVRAKGRKFCEAFLPKKLALEDKVLYGTSKSYQRSELWVRTKTKELLDLSDDPEGLNEVTCKDKGKYKEDFEAFIPKVPIGSNGLNSDSVSPTGQSSNAIKYMNERNKFNDSKELDKVVAEIKKLVDPDPKRVWRLVGHKEEFDIRKRLDTVAKAIKEYHNLFPEYVKKK